MENCNSGTRQWIHLYYTAAEHHGPSCLGHPGTYVVPNHNTVFQSFCTGNNFGVIRGLLSSHGSPTSVTFVPGQEINLTLHDVSITDFRGESDSNTCPQ